MEPEEHHEESEGLVAHAIRCGEEMLAAIEAELKAASTSSDDWKGRPFHPMYRSLREKHAEEFRGDLAQLRKVEAARVAGLTDVLGLERPGDVRGSQGGSG